MSRLTRETVSGTWNSLGQERMMMRGRKKIIDIDSFILGLGFGVVGTSLLDNALN